MSFTNTLRKLVHRKSWEYLAPLPLVNANGSFLVSDKNNLTPNSIIFYISNAASIFRYDGDEDSWLQLPTSGIAGAFGLGACGEFRGLGALGGVFEQSATGGGLNTINTNRTIVRNLAGRRIRVTSGLGIGFDSTIVSNTIGSNAIITVSGGTTFDASTRFQIFSGSMWFQNAGASAGFAVYDIATNTWTAKSAVGITWGTEGYLIATPSSITPFASGTVTAGAATTLTDSTRGWLTNQWANSQVRITAGTGIGQIRTISSNTATVLTVSSAWTINPDATSEYVIEANDDYFYLLGNNAVTLYRYSVASNTWTTLSPGSVRSGAPGAGCSGAFIDSASTWVLNSNGSPNLLTATGAGVYKQNGRYILSFRGGNTSALDMYDIALNTWISSIEYGNRNEAFSTTANSVDYKGDIYIMKEATGRINKFSVDDWAHKSFTFNPIPAGVNISGVKLAILPYEEGGESFAYLYSMYHTRQDFLRMLII